MNNILINQDFENAIKRLRAILPKLSFALLIATYLISALIMGIFHAQNATDVGMKIAAFLIPLAIQTGRGTLVFFFQLNPARLQDQISIGIIAATVLLLLSLWEAWLVMSVYGLAWTVSVGTLMIIGWVIEVMILKETLFTTQMQLYQNKAQWQELQEFYLARAELHRFMQDVRAGKRPNRIEDEGAGEKKKEAIGHLFPNHEEPDKILNAEEGNVCRPSLNGQHL
ncbi:hypothetical protein [Lewinella sp. LCG006]|uniref:hypothetical protein n=1 Tax=Lewinella sp. LCG006 TaxID=3231911 RepID=UPI00346030A6